MKNIYLKQFITIFCLAFMGLFSVNQTLAQCTISVNPTSATVCAGSPTTLTATFNTSSTRTYAIPLAQLINQGSSCDGTGVNRYNGCAAGNSGFSWTDIGSGTVTNVTVQFYVGIECAVGAHTSLLDGVAGPTYSTTIASCNCVNQTGGGEAVTLNFPNPVGYAVGSTNTFLTAASNCFGFIQHAALNNNYAIVTVTYSAGGTGSVLWNTGATTNSITVSPGSTTTYSVTGTTAGNTCSANTSATVTVNALPVVTASSNSPVNVGSALNLTSSGGTSYSWTGPNSFSSTAQNPTIATTSVASAGTYTVTATNAAGCSSKATTKVTINSGITNTGLPSTVNAAAAYSTRKLSPNYTGAALNARRSLDNAQADIAFDANGTISNASVATITAAGTSGLTIGTTMPFNTFYGTGNAQVAIYYDQSGNGRNATQATANSQPFIALAGAITTLNGKPAILFNGGPTLNVPFSSTLINAQGTFSAVQQQPGLQSGFQALISWSSGASQFGPGFGPLDAAGKFGLYTTFGSASYVNAGPVVANVPYVIEATWTGSGASVTTTRNGGTAVTGALTNLLTGNIANGTIGVDNGSTYGGYLSELIILPSALSATDRQTLEANQMAYYITPTLTSFTPAAGGSGQTVTLTGTNLSATTAVSFGGTAATSFTVASATSVTATVGAGATGNVSVTTPGGTATLGGFTYLTPATGLNFDGVNDVVNINNTVGNVGSGDFTIEMNIRTTLANTYFFSKRAACGDDNFISMQAVNGKLSMEIDQGSGAVQYLSLTGTTPINNNAWHHIAMTRKSGLVSIYVDGVLETSGTSTANVNNAYVSTLGYSVCTNQNGSLYFAGDMDELRVWSRALCASELTANKGCGLSNTGQTGLVALYHFDQGSVNFNNTGVTTLTDNSGNSNNGTLVNFALSGTTSNWVAGTVSGTCAAFTIPNAAITGTTTVCLGTTTTLANSITGGTWISSNTSVATINASGVVTPVSAGTTTITYTNLCGGVSTASVTVNNTPTPTIYASGATTFCAGGSVNLNVSALGNAMQMNGTQYGQSNNPALPVGNTSRTIEAWVKTTTSTNGVIANWGQPFTNQRSGLIIVNSRIYYVGENNDLQGNINISDGNWHHVAATFDGTTLKLYVDGTLDVSSTKSFNTTGTTLRIGQRSIGDAGSELYNGIMDELRIWNVARTQTELQNNRFAEISGNSSGLVAYYKLNETSGLSLTDASVNNVTSALTAAVNWIPSNAPGSFSTYAWTPGGATTASIAATASGNYTVTVTANGCTATSAPIVVTVNPLPTATISGTTLLYQNSAAPNITFTGANGTAPYTFTYTINNGTQQTVVSSGTTATVSVPTTTAGTFTYALVSVKDASATLCSATVSGSAVVTIYPQLTAPGNALGFNAALPTAVTINQTASVANLGLSGFTLEAWAYYTSASGVYSIIRKSGDYNLFILNGVIGAEVWTAGTSSTQWTQTLGTTALPINRWVHIAAAWDHTAGSFKLYVNGVLETSTNSVSGPQPASENLTLGYSPQFGQGFTGKLDEIHIWNTPRTQTQIQSDLNSVTTAPQTNLVAYYNFDEGIAGANNTGINTLIDLSGNANTGTLNGNFALTGTTTNWVESYAMVVPKANTATSVGSTGFTANWTAPVVGTVTNYLLDVSTSAVFANAITGSPFTIASPTTSFAVTGLAAGTTYYYRVRADKASVTGEGAYSNTIARGTQGITAGSVSGTIVSCAGSASSSPSVQQFTVSGVNLTGNITATAPTGFEISTVATSGFGNTVTLTQSGGTVNSTIIFVRSAATASAGSISGNVVLTSPTTTTVNVAVAGTVNALPTASISGGTNICQNGTAPTVTFTGVNGTAPYTFTYTINSGTQQTVVSSGNTATVTAPTGTVGTFTYALVSVKDASSTLCSNTVSGSVVVVVRLIPIISSITGTQTICSGNATTLTAASSNAASPTFRWYDAASGGTLLFTGAAYTTPVLTANATYYVEVSDIPISCSSPTRTPVTVTVNALPVVTANASSAIVCNGSSVTLTGGGASTYSWTGGVTNGVAFVPSVTTTYTVTGTDVNGCKNTASQTITIGSGASFANTNVYIQASTSATSCDAVVTYPLSVNGGVPAPNVTYTFTGATTGTGAGTGSGQVFNKGVTHVVVVASNNCASPSVAFDITVVDDVQPVVITKNVTAYLDATGHATVVAADINNGSYDNCGTVTLPQSSTGVICATAAEGNSLTLQAPAGKVITGITFASYGTPNGSCGNFSIGGCHANNSVSIVSALAIGQNSVTIDANNSVFGDPCGGTVKRLYIQATYSDAGSVYNYDCSSIGTHQVSLVVSDAAGNSNTGTATVTVVDNIKPTVNTQNLVLCLDASGNAVITAAQINNGSTDNCSIASYSLDKTTFNTTNVGVNTVTLTVTDVNGNSDSKTATVTINALPTLYSVTGGGAYCVGQTNVLVGLSGSQSGISYQLRNNGNTVSTVSGNSSPINFGAQSAAGTYTVFATNVTTGCNIAMTGSASVVANTPPVITISPSATAICAGSAVTLTASQNQTQTRTYSIPLANLVNATNNCGTGGYYSGTNTGFTWTDAGSGTVSNISVKFSIGVECNSVGFVHNVLLNNINTGTSYTNTASSCTCSPRGTASLYTINFTPTNYTVGAANTLLFTNGNAFGFVPSSSLSNAYAIVTVTYSNGGGNTVNNWLWTPGNATTASISVNPSATTNYSVTGTDGNGCTGTATATVTVNPLPVATITAAGATEVCPSNTVSLSANTGSGFTYQWQKNGVNIPSATGSSYAAPVSGDYTVVIRNSNGCFSAPSNSITVKVQDIIPPFFTSTGAVTSATNAQGEVFATSAAGAVVNYTLPVGADNCSVASTVLTAGYASGAVFPIGSTTVTYTVTDGVGLTATSSFTVTVSGLAPSINCPANIVVSSSASACGTIVNYVATETTAIPASTITYSIAPGSFFGVGTKTVTATATNAVGTSICTFTVTVVDDVVPVVITKNITVQLGANGAVSITPADINNGSTDNCSIATYSLDKTNFDCTNVGTNTVTLRVTDIHDNVSTATAIVTVEDKIAPTVITKNITAQLDANGVVSITPADINNGSTDNCSIATYSLDKTSFDCSNVGANTVTLTVTDVNGNVSSKTAVVTVEDKVAPIVITQNVTIQLDANGAASITPAQINNGSTDNCSIASYSLDKTSFDCSNVGTNTVTLTVMDVNGNVATGTAIVTVEDKVAPIVITQNITVQLDVNGAVTITPAQVNNGSTDNCAIATYSLDKTSFDCSNVGTNAVILTVTDVNGNVSTATAVVTVEDKVAPTVITKNITVQLDANGAASITPADINNGSTDNCSIATYSIDKASFDCSNVGANTVTLTVTDVNGNISTATAIVTVEDKVAPIVITQNITIQLDANGAASITPAQINNGSTDNCSIATYSLDKTSFDCSNVGANTVILTVTDVNGNVSTATAVVTVEDKVTPTVITQNITVQLAANGAVTITPAQVNNGSTDNCSIATYSLDKTSFDCSNVGTNTVILTVTDIHGNVSSAPAIVTVEDKVAPIVITQNITIQLDANGAASITPAQINNGSTDNCSIATYSLDKTVFDCSNVGANTVTLTVTDVNGNVSTGTAVVTVEDKVAPTVITKNITVQLDANGAVTITPAQVNNGSTDNCSIATYSLDKTSFDCSNVGTNTVILTVTDVNGNVSTATAIVTVEDKVAPTVITKNITVQLDANGAVSITPADINNGSTDNCSIATYSIDKASFDCSNVGANTVTLTVTDVNGNVSTATAIVTVEDKVTPTVITQNIKVQLGANGTASITPAQVNNGSTDNCAIASYSLDKTTFDCSNVGVNTVILTVTDVNGNVSTATAVVTVEDKVTPTVITQNITVQLGANGTASITPAQVNNGSTDNCAIASYSLDKTTFDCSNVGLNTVTLTATDVNGNSSSATAVVTIEDHVPAVVITNNITIQLSATGAASITVADINNGSHDACGIASMVLSKTSFDCSNVGPNTVTLTVTDVNGNVSSNTAVVTVKDIIPAVVITKNITIQLNASGSATIAAADVNNGSNDACGIASMTVSPNVFSCANVGANTVTLTVTDVNGNVSSNTAVVTVQDKIAPVVITKPITVYLDGTGHISITAADVNNGSSDACGIASMSVSPNSFDCSKLGANTVTLTVTDVNGNVSFKTAVVTVQDKLGPVPTVNVLPTVTGQCSANIVIVNATCTDNCRCCRGGCHCHDNCHCHRNDNSWNNHSWNSWWWNNDDDDDDDCDNDADDYNTYYMTTPTALDNCSGLIKATTTDPLHYNTQGTYTINWKFVDANGNVTIQPQTVIVKDNEAPIPWVSTLPTISGQCSVNLSLNANWEWWDDDDDDNGYDISAPWAWDNCAGWIRATTTSALSYTTQGTYTIVWKFNDGHGNITIQNQTVVVKDNIAPKATVKNLPTVTGSCSATVTAVPTAKDNCVGIVNGTTTDPLTYTAQGTYTIHWSYTDGHGNTSTQTQTVVVDDDTKPVPMVTTLPTLTGECSVTVTSVPKANDNCKGVITGTTTDPLTYSSKGTYTIHWSYNDGNGNITNQNQTVVINDVTAPVPQVSTLPTLTGECSVTVTSVPKANDNCKGVITATTSDALTYNKQGTYTIRWSYNDGNGNITTQNQTVVISDVTKPTITAPAAAIVSCGTSTAPTVSATATDNCSTPTVTYSDVTSGNTITRTWKATDAAGNYSTAAQTLTIVDNTAPIITDPRDVTVSCGTSTDPSVTGRATATDNCSTPTVSYTDVTSGYTITRTWKATDASNNSATSVQVITIVDNTKPTITDIADVTVNCNGSTDPSATGTPTASDNCSAVTLSKTDVPSGNTIIRTWKATDASGNYATSVQVITIGVPFTTSISSVPTSNTYTGGVSTNLYLGYGAQSTSLQVGSLPSSGAPYTYVWSGTYTNKLSSTTTAAPVFTPTQFGYYTFSVTVTNKYGCTASCSISICVTDVRVPGTNGAKIYVTHTPNGKNAVAQTLQVALSSVSSHIGSSSCGSNGNDRLGSADQSPCNTTIVTNTGVSSSGIAKDGETVNTAASEEDLKVTAMPNPSTTFFTLKIESRFQTPVELRVMDGRGRVVDAKSKIGANSTIQIGHNYSSGTYYAELIQGTQRKVVQLIKGRG